LRYSGSRLKKIEPLLNGIELLRKRLGWSERALQISFLGGSPESEGVDVVSRVFHTDERVTRKNLINPLRRILTEGPWSCSK
jgi:hypothetical protein